MREPLKRPACGNRAYPITLWSRRGPVYRQLGHCCSPASCYYCSKCYRCCCGRHHQTCRQGTVGERRFFRLWWGHLLQGSPPLRLLQQRSCSYCCCCCRAVRQQQLLLPLLQCTRRGLLEALSRGAAAHKNEGEWGGQRPCIFE